MFIPAILKKQEIELAFKKYYYSDEMMFETGSLDNWLPEISENPNAGRYQFAIVDNNEKLIGYVDYTIDWYSSCAHRFGLISFDKGNILIGKAIKEIMDKLINEYHLHRIEWRMIGGNPVERSYDRFCKKYNGNKYVLKDVFKDRQGNYHDDCIYEIIFDN